MKNVKHRAENVARWIDAKMHTHVVARTLKTANHGGHAAYLGAVFLESHYSYGLIAGGLFVLFVINVWLNFDAEG